MRKKCNALHLFLFFLALLVPSLAHAQGYVVNDFAISGFGRPIGGAQVAVCTTLTTTAASVNQNFATLTFASNPITAGFVQGMTVDVSGFTGSDTYFNNGHFTSSGLVGGYVITSLTVNSITFKLTHANSTATTAGLVVQQGNAQTSCAPQINIYTDYTLATQITQPTVTSGIGNYTFAIGPQQVIYVQLYGPGVTTTLKQVTPPCTVGSTCAGGGGGGGGGSSGLLLTKTCQIIIGDDSGIPLSTGNIQPQRSQCYLYDNSTVANVILLVNSGASTIQLGYRHNGILTALSSVLTPAAVAGVTDPVACANLSGTALIIEGNSVTCGTLSNTALTAGDYIETMGGTADGTTTRVSAEVTFAPNSNGGGSSGMGAPGGPLTSIQTNNLGNFGGSSFATLDLLGNETVVTLGLSGATSGVVRLRTQAVEGTPAVAFGTSSGTVAVAVTSPLMLGAATGIMGCPNCVIAVSPGVGILHMPGGSQTGTSSLLVAADVTSNTLTSTQMSNTGVVAGSYVNTSITVDAAGRITSASSGAGGGGANVSLSNLTSTAVNAILLPGTAATYALGSTTFPWSNIVIGNAAGQTATFDVSAAMGNRTYALPDASGTLALLGLGQNWTAKQLFNVAFGCPETTAPAAVSGQDILYCDSTTHALMLSNNGGGFGQLLSGTIGVPNGGTGLTALTAHYMLVGNGASAVTLVAPGTSSFCWTSNGASADPSWQACPGGGSSLAISGLLAAAAGNTIGNGDFDQRWNWSLTTNTTQALYLAESGASTATGSFLLRVSTLSTSTLDPVRFDNNGNGIVMNATGHIEALGTGYVDWASLGNFPGGCTNQFITTLAASPTCATVNLTSMVTGILPRANGGTAISSAPVKRMEINFASCDDSSGTPVIASSWARAASGSFTPQCKIDGSNGTVQGVLQAAHSTSAYATVVLPADWASFNTAYLLFTTTDTTNGHTAILDVQTACTQPNANVADTPAYNAVNAFTTVTLGGGAVSGGLYATTTTGNLTGTGCGAGYVLHLLLSRSASDTVTDTAIQLTGSLVLGYNGAFN